MKAVVVVIALALSACSMTPAQHARLAVSASQAIAALAPLVQADADGDFEAAGGEAMPLEERAKRAAEWDRKLEILHGARDLVQQYGALAKQAEDSDDVSILAPIARRVVRAWVDVLTIADELGLPFPEIPRKLAKYAEAP